LRTSFVVVKDSPVQRIAGESTINVPIVELSALPEVEQQAEAARVASEQAQYRFQLEHGPLLRVLLLRKSAGQHILLLVVHHIISDRWSMDILVREILLLYAGYSRDETPVLPELELQYADYAVWQRKLLQGTVLANQLSFWKQQLSGIPAFLELPGDRSRPNAIAYEGRTEVMLLAAGLLDQLRAISRSLM